MIDLRNLKITIVGMGLMGGSLAGALRPCGCLLVGVDRDPQTNEIAMARRLVDRATTDLEDGVCGADMVILATPVRTILRLLDEIAALIDHACVVMDLGSTKARVVAKMQTLPQHLQPLGGHPMCGREISGIGAADALLYRGNAFVLSPLERTSGETLDLAHAMVKAIGAHPMLLDAERHDRVVAMTSHLPYLLACSLVAAAQMGAAVEDKLWNLAASGFRDTSRLAGSNVEMMLDILLTNREAILRSLSIYRVQLNDLVALIEREDEDGLRRILNQCQQCRSGLAV